MAGRRTARDIEASEAGRSAPRHRSECPANLALAMLARRGFRPLSSSYGPALRLGDGLDEQGLETLADLLGHYAFRLFLRGALQRPDGLAPGEATRYVSPARAEKFAAELLELGLAEPLAEGRFRLVKPAHNFGGTLEWYVARELGRRLGYETAVGVKLTVPGVGGDLDVVAAADGKLAYLEVKSGPPKHLTEPEVAAFFRRLRALRPDVALFVVDTALRLSDKVVPMLADEIERLRPGDPPRPRRLEREIWALTPHLYVVNAKLDLVGNIGRAIAEGLRALAPPPP